MKSEAQPQTESDHPLVNPFATGTGSAADLAEIGRSGAPLRIREMWGVRQVQALSAPLHLPALRHVELPEKAEIQVGEAGTAYRAEARSSKTRIGHGPECRHIEILLPRPRATEDRDVALDLVGALRISRRIQRRPRGTHVEWCPRVAG